MVPDIGADSIVGILASSTTQYLGVYSPVFALGIGILLAFGIFGYLLSLLAPIRAAQLRESYDNYEDGTHFEDFMYRDFDDD